MIAVDPWITSSNTPDIVFITDDYQYTWEGVTYWKSGPCYWHQNQQNGFTCFLYQSPQLTQIGPHLWQGPRTEGFGGHLFKLKSLWLGHSTPSGCVVRRVLLC